MKNILKILTTIIILAILIIVIERYIVLASSKEEKNAENYIYEEVINMTAEQDIFSAEDNNEIVEQITENVISKDEKYTKEYKTSNGEKYTIIANLKISKINIDYDIFSSTSTTLLKMSLNKYWGAQPNEVGNMCIVGHNYLDTRFFGRLHTLENGDVVEITDSYDRTEKYYIYDIFVADPYDTRCTSQCTNGEKEITLITCYNGATQRLIVKARAERDITTDITMNIVNKILENIK